MTDDRDAEKRESDEDEFEQRLREIDERMKQAGRSELPPVPNFEYRRKSRPASESQKETQTRYAGLAAGLQVAYLIMGTPIGFYAIGWLIDRQVGGNQWQSWLALFGAVAGLVLGIWTLNRLQSKL
jgi:F0F1-type ATP synthase assembly protein I